MYKAMVAAAGTFGVLKGAQQLAQHALRKLAERQPELAGTLAYCFTTGSDAVRRRAGASAFGGVGGWRKRLGGALVPSGPEARQPRARAGGRQ